MTYKHILVPFDESPLARAALSIAAWLAWRNNGETDLVRAVPHEAHELLLKAGVNSERAYSFGDAAEEILQFAERGKFDVVAIGTHGRTGLDRVVMGSVAEQVVQHATIPVLVTGGAAASVPGSVAMPAGAHEA